MKISCFRNPRKCRVNPRLFGLICLVAHSAASAESLVVDEFIPADFPTSEVSAPQSYVMGDGTRYRIAAWNNTSATPEAEITWRVSTEASSIGGIYVDSAEGEFRKVEFQFSANQRSGETRVLWVYGSKTPYKELGDVYDPGRQGTLLATVMSEPSKTVSVELPAGYRYIAVGTPEKVYYRFLKISMTRDTDAGAPTVPAATPVVYPSDGSMVSGASQITLSTETPDAGIRFTLDGSEPSADNGYEYQGPFFLEDYTSTTDPVLKAMAIHPQLLPSAVAVARFRTPATISPKNYRKIHDVSVLREGDRFILAAPGEYNTDRAWTRYAVSSLGWDDHAPVGWQSALADAADADLLTVSSGAVEVFTIHFIDDAGACTIADRDGRLLAVTDDYRLTKVAAPEAGGKIPANARLSISTYNDNGLTNIDFPCPETSNFIRLFYVQQDRNFTLSDFREEGYGRPYLYRLEDPELVVGSLNALSACRDGETYISDFRSTVVYSGPRLTIVTDGESQIPVTTPAGASFSAGDVIPGGWNFRMTDHTTGLRTVEPLSLPDAVDRTAAPDIRLIEAGESQLSELNSVTDGSVIAVDWVTYSGDELPTAADMWYWIHLGGATHLAGNLLGEPEILSGGTRGVYKLICVAGPMNTQASAMAKAPAEQTATRLLYPISFELITDDPTGLEIINLIDGCGTKEGNSGWYSLDGRRLTAPVRGQPCLRLIKGEKPQLRVIR